MRTYYWYVTAYLKKHGKIVFLSILLGIVLFMIATPFFLRRLSAKPTKYIGMVGDYSLTSLPLNIQRQLSLGLTNLAADGAAVPSLAERWIVEDNGKSYRFVLRQNMTWQDGRPFKSSDVSYRFEGVEVVTTPNDVIFKLPDAYAPFPVVVSQPLIRTESQRYWWFFVRPQLIGLGEYRLLDYKLNGQRLTQLTLESNRERLIYRFYLTEDDAVLGFKHGQVDVLPDLGSSYDLQNWPNVSITPQLHTERYLAVFFNNASPLFPKNVRQALAYAMTKPDASTRAIGPVNPNSWAYFDGGKTYDYDLDKAQERLLAEPPTQPLNIELTTTTVFQPEAEQIKQEWEQLGQLAVKSCQNSKDIKEKALCANMLITVNLRLNNFPDTTNFQVLLIGQESPPDPDQYSNWHSDQSTNFTAYKNTRIDSLLEKGRQTIDQSERKAIYQEFQQFMLEDVPAIFIRYLESYEIRRK